MFTNKLLIFLLTFLAVNASFGQRKGHFNVSLTPGFMYYQGDLSGSAIPNVNTTHLSIAADGGYSPNDFFNFTIGYSFGKLSGDDALVSGHEKRNFNFYTYIHDFRILSYVDLNTIRRHFFPRKTLDRSEFEPKFTGPNLILGFGYLRFNPKSKMDGTVYQLHKLGTEGQRISSGGYPEPYKLWQFNMKYGFGLGYDATQQINIQLQFIYTQTFTDYIDDVSGTYPDYDELINSNNGEITSYFTYGGRDGSVVRTGQLRGNADKNDGYLTIGFKVTYTLGKSQLERMINF